MIDNLTPAEMSEFNTLTKVLRVMNWDIDSSQIKQALSGLSNVDLEGFTRASNTARTLEYVERQEEIVEQRSINADLKDSLNGYKQQIVDLKEEILSLKEENTKLKNEAKEATTKILNNCIDKINELKEVTEWP